MAFFPRAGDFSPLFRLLDDYNTHRSVSGQPSTQSSSSLTSFAPRFDVRETKDAYRLDGELPGVSQKNIEIEFSDPQTLHIKGRVVREYNSNNSSGNNDNDSGAASPKPATVEDEPESDSSNTQAVEKTSNTVSKHKSNHKYWVSERSVGEFHRSFNFPTRVDQDAVTAGLKDGILSISVPKAAPPVSRKINIE
jgi:HSP20 family molecular chaperone IbpA